MIANVNLKVILKTVVFFLNGNSVTKLDYLALTIAFCISPTLNAQDHSDQVKSLYDLYISVMEDLYLGSHHQKTNTHNLRQAKRTLEENSIFKNNDARIEDDFNPIDVDGKHMPQWRDYLTSYKGEFNNLGKMEFPDEKPKICHEKPKIEIGDTIYLYYSKWFANKKKDTIYRKMEVYVKNGSATIGSIRTITREKFVEPENCFESVPPTIKILSPPTDYIFWCRLNNVDTIRWKTHLKPPFQLELWGDKDQEEIYSRTINTPALTIDSTSRDTTYYKYIWSPKPNICRDKVLTLKISKQLKAESIEDSRQVTIKPVIKFLVPLKNAEYNALIPNSWEINPIFLKSIKQQGKVGYKIKIVDAADRKPHYDTLLYSSTYILVSANEIINQDGKKIDGSLDKKLRTEIVLELDDNIYVESSEYELKEREPCDDLEERRSFKLGDKHNEEKEVKKNNRSYKYEAQRKHKRELKKKKKDNIIDVDICRPTKSMEDRLNRRNKRLNEKLKDDLSDKKRQIIKVKIRFLNQKYLIRNQFYQNKRYKRKIKENRSWDAESDDFQTKIKKMRNYFINNRRIKEKLMGSLIKSAKYSDDDIYEMKVETGEKSEKKLSHIKKDMLKEVTKKEQKMILKLVKELKRFYRKLKRNIKANSNVNVDSSFNEFIKKASETLRCTASEYETGYPCISMNQ